MSVTVKAIPATNKAITDYVKFGIELYDGNEQFVPPMIFDEVHTLLPDKNPAFDYCRAQCFMAYRDGKPVGRITALINDQINEKLNKKEARFGFVISSMIKRWWMLFSKLPRIGREMKE